MTSEHETINARWDNTLSVDINGKAVTIGLVTGEGKKIRLVLDRGSAETLRTAMTEHFISYFGIRWPLSQFTHY